MRQKIQDRRPLIDVLFVIAPHSLLLDVAGPAEVFRLANLHRARAGKAPRFNLRFASAGTTVATSVGLTLANVEALPKNLTQPTWLVVVGQPLAHVRRVTPEITEIARFLGRVMRGHLERADSPHRLVTVCSGTLLAARSGLLVGRRCTTHHELLGQLKALAPDVTVLANRVFVVDGRVASSAGIVAGIDLALHLVAEECGEDLAVDVAEDMVVYMRRSSRDAELSPFLKNRRHHAAAVHRVQQAVSAAPERAWNMPAMAEIAHVTERHLLRLFQQHSGASPLDFLRTIRLERARQLIERGAGVARAAELAGFNTSLSLRRAWRLEWGGTPRNARSAAALA